ncbi:acetate kinase [Heliorestis acidaminivorans]|uniref:Acetate kinase n=1 Tax=Heliorestis acidaminivorans TaxID=553427 RepID=A0A6I0F369_9FIRM|nr:acetate kinase [Heliorestis acidaminivorans]KAB2954451.1 acetate kinase [Heliorestis acidaminivorans]
MIVLVINSGSSSLKYQIFDMKEEQLLAKGLVDRIGISGSSLTHQPLNKEALVVKEDIENHNQAIELTVKALTHQQQGVIKEMNEIDAIGHRVAHGGDRFADSTVISDEVSNKIAMLFDVAPLHNPPALMGIEACARMLPKVTQVAVFDTAFHQSIPEKAYIYALPYEISKKYSLRRYGFHGTSHKYVAQKAAEFLQKDISALKLITCHLGNGASIAAVNGGKSVDTSMGFTPLEGLVMGTRVGDIDPASLLFLMEKENMNIEEMNSFLNKKCGVLGISGLSSDFRDLEEAAKNGEHRCQLALDIFAYRVKKYIGAYSAVMNGVDGIIFTAGLGENSPTIRQAITEDLGYLGAELDHEKNNRRGEKEISKQGSRCKILVIPTNEELMIARDTFRLVKTS